MFFRSAELPRSTPTFHKVESDPVVGASAPLFHTTLIKFQPSAPATTSIGCWNSVFVILAVQEVQQIVLNRVDAENLLSIVEIRT